MPKKKTPVSEISAVKHAVEKSTSKKRPRKKAPTQKKSPTEKTVRYPDIGVKIYKKGFPDSIPIDVAEAKNILGWQEESDGVKFGQDFLFKDMHGNKVRCLNDTTNRPFDPALARDWMLEILRRKWKFNFETIVIDQLGQVQDGQHRLVGEVWAHQKWEQEPDRWPQWNGSPPYFESLVCTGLDPGDETVNTLGTNKPRGKADVIYRSTYFADFPIQERIQVARATEWAIKLLWKRTGYDQNAFIPRRSHSELLGWIDRHRKVIDSVKFVWSERESLKPLIPLGYASALLFLQGSSRTQLESYDADVGEGTLDWGLWDDACDYWVHLSQGVEEFAPLKKYLGGLESGGGHYRDCICALVAKSWVAVTNSKPITAKLLALDITVDELERPTLNECPLVGGIDVGGEVDEEEDED